MIRHWLEESLVNLNPQLSPPWSVSNTKSFQHLKQNLNFYFLELFFFKMVSADMLSLRRLTDYYNYVMTDLRDPRFVNGFCFCFGNF